MMMMMMTTIIIMMSWVYYYLNSRLFYSYRYFSCLHIFVSPAPLISLLCLYSRLPLFLFSSAPLPLPRSFCSLFNPILPSEPKIDRKINSIIIRNKLSNHDVLSFSQLVYYIITAPSLGSLFTVRLTPKKKIGMHLSFVVIPKSGSVLCRVCCMCVCVFVYVRVKP